jgi:hypothetical protein
MMVACYAIGVLMGFYSGFNLARLIYAHGGTCMVCGNRKK